MYLVFTSSKRLLSAIILISIILFVLAIQLFFPQIIPTLENQPKENIEGMTVNDTYDSIAKVLEDYSSNVNQKLDVVKALIPIIEDKAVSEQMKSIIMNSNLSDQDKIARISDIVKVRSKHVDTVPITATPQPSMPTQTIPPQPSITPQLPAVSNAIKPPVMLSQAR